MPKRRRCVDDGEFDALRGQRLNGLLQFRLNGLCVLERLLAALGAPVSQMCLGIDVDDGNGPDLGPLRLHGYVARERGLARAGLLGSKCEHPHRVQAPNGRAAIMNRISEMSVKAPFPATRSDSANYRIEWMDSVVTAGSSKPDHG